MAAFLLLVGALLVIAGAGFIYWPAAVVTAGVLCVAAGVDLTRRETP